MKYYSRKSIRLKGYDYSQQGLYFITILCHNRLCLFGDIVNGEMILNEAGQIVKEEWMNTLNIRQNVALHEFVVMPNHFHAIIEITHQIGQMDSVIGQFKSPSHSVGAIIRGFKIATTKQLKQLWIDKIKGKSQYIPVIVWHRNYYDIIIRNDEAYQRISEYIANNPKQWKEDGWYKDK